MRPSEGERLCQEAQIYYYDLLCQEEAAAPTVVRRHVATCPACQEEMRRLREALFEAQRPPSASGTWEDETIEALAQQFQLLDERVTCSEAKPLLPELAMASPRIRIPTPLTVHLDHCPQCAGDLAAIEELHLTADQLKRLGRLLAAGRGARLPPVESPATPNAINRLWEPVPPSNRGREARDTGDSPAPAAPASLSFAGADIACSGISMADLFDCVVPSDAVPADGKTASERLKTVARHVQTCPECLAKGRTLQRTIGEIVARANSEIATVYHAENDAEEAEGEYPYPVSVQVLHSQSEAAVDASAAPAAPATGLRGRGRSAKPLAALAALVLIGIALASLLRTTTSTVSGTNVGAVDKILATVENVHIVRRDREGKLVQEFWIDHRLNILVSRTPASCVLDDLAHDRRRTIDLQTGVRTSERLSQVKVQRDRARQFMASCLRDLVAGVSPDTELRPAAGEIDSGAGKDFDVYELPSLPRARTLPRRDCRLVYIDRVTGLPQKMEFYRHKLGEGRGDPVTTTIFTYPTGPEMEEDIQALFPAQ